jgi:hypothetical protein
MQDWAEAEWSMDFELLADASNPNRHACAGKSVNPVARRSHRRKCHAEFLLIPKRDTGLISDLDGNRHVREENGGASDHCIFRRPTRVGIEIKDVVVKNSLIRRALVNAIPHRLGEATGRKPPIGRHQLRNTFKDRGVPSIGENQ